MSKTQLTTLSILVSMFVFASSAAAWSAEGGSTRRSNARPAVSVQPPYETVWKHKVVDGLDGLLEHGVTVAAGRVFGATIDGTTFALNATTGKLLWKRSLGRRLATTPTYHRGFLYVQAKRSGNGARLWKLNARTGQARWSRRLGAGSEGGPLVVGRRVYVSSGNARLQAWSLNGTRRWQRRLCHMAWQAPTWTGRHVVVADYCGYVRAFTPTGRLRWRTRLNGGVYAATNAVGRRLYVHTKAGLLYALNARTGRRIWTRRTGRGIGYPECAATRTRVWCANGWRDNRLSSWRASDGRRLWTRRLPGQVMGAVVLTRRMLWVGIHDDVPPGKNYDVRAVLGYNPANGRLRWRSPQSARYDPLAVGRGGLLYVIHYARIRAIRAAT